MPSPIHAVLVIITGWHNQSHFTLLPTPRPQASFPSPTHYYLARHWCSGARNVMKLICQKSKIREKTDLGALGRRQAQPGDCGRLFLPDQRDQGKGRLKRGKGGMRERVGGGGGGGQIALVKGLRTKEAGLCHLVKSHNLHPHPHPLSGGIIEL